MSEDLNTPTGHIHPDTGGGSLITDAMAEQFVWLAIQGGYSSTFTVAQCKSAYGLCSTLFLAILQAEANAIAAMH